MYQLGLGRADFAAYRTMLATPGHLRRIRLEVLTLNLQHLRSMTPSHVDGQVVVDVHTKPSRMLTLKVADPSRSLAFEPSSPGGPPLYRDKVIRVWYCIYVDAIGDWVECPVFTGPVWDFDRTGADVNLVAHGMERQAMGQIWHPFHRDPGYPKVIAMRDLMAQAAGDSLPAFPPPLGDRLPVGLSLSKMDSAWPHVRKIAESMNRHVFYNGYGWAQLREYGTKPVFVFDDELTEEASFARSKGNVVNTVEVLGANPKGPKRRVGAVAVAPKGHPLSPWSLGRAGSQMRLVEQVENDHFRTDAECQAVADRKLERHLHERTTIQLSSLPIPFLEERDMVAVDTPDLGRVRFRLRQFTLPLGLDGTPMTVGAVRKSADVGSPHHG